MFLNSCRTYAICVMPFSDCVTTVPSEQVFKIANADCTSSCALSGTTQMRKGGLLPPPKDLFEAITSSLLFLRIWRAW